MSDIRICWLLGAHYLRKESVNGILGFKEYKDREIYLCDSNDELEDIVSKVLTETLFSESRIVHIKGLPKANKKTNKMLVEAFEAIPPECLVLVDGPRKDSYPTIFKAVKKSKHGKIVEMPYSLDDGDSMTWLLQRAKEDEKEFEEDAIKAFLRSLPRGGDKKIDCDVTELNYRKLLAFVGEAEKISEADVRMAIDPDIDSVIWDMFRCADNRDFRGLLEHFHICVSEGAEPTDKRNIADYLLNRFAWRYKLILSVKEAKLSGMQDRDIYKMIGAIPKLKREGTTGTTSFKKSEGEDGSVSYQYSEGMIKSTLNGYYGSSAPVDKYSRGELYRIVNCIEECFVKFRWDYEANAFVILDNLALTICGLMKEKRLAPIREVCSAV